MRNIRTIAGAATAAALATTTLIGLSPAAHAASGTCSYDRPLKYGWTVTECLETSGYRGTTNQTVEDTGATTDVRIYDELWNDCTGAWSVVASNYRDGGIHAIPRQGPFRASLSWSCGTHNARFQAHVYETESGKVVDGFWTNIIST
ncbi:hypothetical protein [Streptomyces sp. BPTC-684]|uniref:hypothetical protein n=1 Tax=Streptomyces sp. BPTC-684 TaxID=3043734 RepID=UPI0024B19FC5|nr:hypothetical protein [Streptomyces sp. BPTC-684]WHM40989.1 hypothetical protein QIY60_31725 [Streptomyces sp. BPTC-684]